ncbi:family 20 glycosylhydrolase [Streptomyces sp. BK208]|uniref:family 20 glycosylhydrolase n=1 Tax=Streptomyces sp. BK208 TaxID=2512150 RepID=UPI0032639DB0
MPNLTPAPGLLGARPTRRYAMHAVFPAPADHVVHGGPSDLPAAGPWRLSSADPALAEVERTVRALLEPHLGRRLLPVGSASPGAEIRLELDASVPAGRRTRGVAPDGGPGPADEVYAVSVREERVLCRGRTPAGVFRAATTALQLIGLAEPDETLAPQEFTDAPHYAWRGLLLDTARRFIPVPEMHRLIDLAALYKINVLHLHLTDNEGWRIEIPSLPALTAGSADGGLYTVDEYRALQEYAASRHIVVVPEIDLPGHCAALRAALPGLPPAPAPPGLAGRFPYTPPLDLADPGTRELVRTILADVCALTDGPFVHIGGDEALGITEQGFATALNEVRTMVRELGKRPVAWQESSRAGIGPQDIAQFWVDPGMMDLPGTEEELARRPDLVGAGFTGEFVAALKRFFAPSAEDARRVLDGGGMLLLSPQSHLYLDRRYAQEVAPPERAEQAAGLGFPSYRPRSVEYIAGWDPRSHALPEERIAGVEATLFSENLRDFEELTTLLLPRLASVASTAWSGGPQPWREHRRALGRHSRLWRDRGLAFFPATDVDWS